MYAQSSGVLMKRQLPKLMACMTKTSLENMRNRELFSVDLLDAKGIRRRKLPLHKWIVLELKEAGFNESSDYLQDLIYDNIQLVNEDEIGVVVDLRQRQDYLEFICQGLKTAEKHRDLENTKEECLALLSLAQYFAEKGKGILWLAEKFFLAAIAVSSQYLIDGGRQKACCKFYYGKFLLDKFPGADSEEAFLILTEVRDCSIGKTWPLEEPPKDGSPPPSLSVFVASAVQLHRVLLAKSRDSRKKKDPSKAERLARLAERRARDANEMTKLAEAIVEIGICQLMMNNLNNAQKTFEKAYSIYYGSENLEGICDTKMHLAAVMQRLGDHETAAKLLTEMGTLAMKNGLRRQLGRALHLLGELHLRREKPELGTQHLAEAFACFMGYGFQKGSAHFFGDEIENLEVIYNPSSMVIYEEEAEQSRLMMSISAGQELMASYFDLLREANGCTVAQIKVIEWKLQRSGWWLKKFNHDLIPCMCPDHNRTPLDVLNIKLERLKMKSSVGQEYSTGGAKLGRIDDYPDIRFLRSSLHADASIIRGKFGLLQ